MYRKPSLGYFYSLPLFVLLTALVGACSFDSGGLKTDSVADIDDPPCIDCPLSCANGDGVCDEDCPTDPDCVVCGNGICEIGESCDGRKETESCESDCPKGNQGKGGTCWVNGVCEGKDCDDIDDINN